MSDNPLATPGALPPSLPDTGMQPGAGLQPAPTASPSVSMIDHAGTQAAMRGFSPTEMLRHRDDAGREMTRFAGFMNDPDVKKQDVSQYIEGLTEDGTLSPAEAQSILVSFPNSARAIHEWARMMFHSLAHASVHAHAAYPRELYPPQDQGGQAGALEGGALAMPGMQE